MSYKSSRHKERTLKNGQWNCRPFTESLCNLLLSPSPSSFNFPYFFFLCPFFLSSSVSFDFSQIPVFLPFVPVLFTFFFRLYRLSLKTKINKNSKGQNHNLNLKHSVRFYRFVMFLFEFLSYRIFYIHIQRSMENHRTNFNSRVQ